MDKRYAIIQFHDNDFYSVAENLQYEIFECVSCYSSEYMTEEEFKLYIKHTFDLFYRVQELNNMILRKSNTDPVIEEKVVEIKNKKDYYTTIDIELTDEEPSGEWDNCETMIIDLKLKKYKVV